YRYVSNNPVNAVDPSGLQEIDPRILKGEGKTVQYNGIDVTTEGVGWVRTRGLIVPKLVSSDIPWFFKIIEAGVQVQRELIKSEDALLTEWGDQIRPWRDTQILRGKETEVGPPTMQELVKFAKERPSWTDLQAALSQRKDIIGRLDSIRHIYDHSF